MLAGGPLIFLTKASWVFLYELKINGRNSYQQFIVGNK